MSVDLEILDILLNCDYPRSSFKNFVGITRPDLRRMTLEDLELRLRSRLPPSPARASLVSKFISHLSNGKEEGQVLSTVSITIKHEVKQEADDCSRHTPPSTQPLGDKIEIIENNRNNIFQEVQQRSEENNLGVPKVRPQELENEQENNPVQQVNNAQDNSCSFQSTIPPVESEAEDSESEVTILDEVMGEDVPIICILDTDTKANERVLHSVTIADDESPTITSHKSSSASKKRKAEITVNPKPSSSASTTSSSNPCKVIKKSAFVLGRTSRQCSGTQSVEWTMEEFRDLTSRAQSPFVEQLSIVSNCELDYNSSSLSISLPFLASLKIRHRVKPWGDESLSSFDVNYSRQLALILDGSPSLSHIDICYEDEMALKTLLHVLGSVKRLSSLSSLVIRHRDEVVAFVASELAALSQIKAPNLKELHLACGFWAEGDGTGVKGAFQLMLKRFPNLRKLKIEGCFVTTPSTTDDSWPNIVLDFPKLVHLQVLDLGASFGIVEELPKKKKWRKLDISLDPEPGQDFVEVDATPVLPKHVNLMDDECGDDFAVFINLPGVMPCLKSVTLGVFYEFKSLNFSNLPVLKVFRVASQWVQSYPYCFPIQTGKKSKKFKVEQLQFPDSFKDCYLITKILPHFPHLTHIYLTLPTVKFLRAFAKTIQTTGPKLKHLKIKTQFDFASSLDSCILDEISQPSQDELEKIKILKTYPQWEGYVEKNSIELSLTNGETEDPKKFCGLHTIFKKLKSLSIIHIPRTLRIPTGPRHWIDHPQPEFTNTSIGFKEYPFTKAVKAKCPAKMKITCQDFDMSEVKEDFEVHPYYENLQVSLDPTDVPVKNEGKPTKCTTSSEDLFTLIITL